MKFFLKLSAAFFAGLVVTIVGQAVDFSSSTPAQTTQVAEAESQTTTVEPVLGITTQQPDEKPFVALPDGRFMVPYTTSIPGTNVKFTMIPIPGGKFLMGSPDSEAGRAADEGPQFEVAIKPCWMGQHEVTWAEYRTYMELDDTFKAFHRQNLRLVEADNEIDAVTAPSALYEPTFTFEPGGENDQAAASMSQFAAKQYTKYLSLTSNVFYRLPTEVEWEYACRAGTTTAYYFGDDPDQLDQHGWYLDNSDEVRHAVGQLKPNPWGLYDMYGNVAEWVLDMYSEDGYTHVPARSVTSEQAFHQPTELFPRAIRGGCYLQDAEECRSASRLPSDDELWVSEDPNSPTSPWWFACELEDLGNGVGFRIIRPLDEPVSRDDKEQFWSADIDWILEDAKHRIKENGRGAYGVIDPQLPKEFEALKKK